MGTFCVRGHRRNSLHPEFTAHLDTSDIEHTHTYTHMMRTGEQEQSKKSGERKLLRSCRAALDVFRSVDSDGNVQLWTVGVA